MTRIVTKSPRDSRSDHRGVGGEMRSAMAWLRFLRIFLYLELWGELLSLGLSMSFPSDLPEPPWGLFTPAWIAVRIAAVLIAIHFMDRRPVPGALTVAVLYSLVFASVLHAVATNESYLPHDLIRPGFWMVCTWITVFQALRIVRLARANPDAYLARLMRGEDPGETVGHEAQMLRDNLARRRKQSRVLLATGTLAALMLAFAI